MKSFLLSSFAILLLSAVIAPVARAESIAVKGAQDLNGDGMISLTEVRIHYLNIHDSSR